MEGDAAHLELRLSVWIDAALHWGLQVTNRAAVPVEFKTAFPHLSGLAISAGAGRGLFFLSAGLRGLPCSGLDSQGLRRL